MAEQLAQAEQVREKSKSKKKHSYAAIAVCLALVISGASILNAQNESGGYIVIEEQKTPLAALPNVNLSNPADSTSYLTFEVILEKTGESLYKSELVKPGNVAENFTLERPLEEGEHRAVLITRSYEKGGLEETDATRTTLILTVE